MSKYHNKINADVKCLLELTRDFLQTSTRWCNSTGWGPTGMALEARSKLNRPCNAIGDRAVKWTLNGALIFKDEDHEFAPNTLNRARTMVVREIKKLDKRFWYPELPKSLDHCYDVLVYFNDCEHTEWKDIDFVLNQAIQETEKLTSSKTNIRAKSVLLPWRLPKNAEAQVKAEKAKTLELIQQALQGSDTFAEKNAVFLENAVDYFDQEIFKVWRYLQIKNAN